MEILVFPSFSYPICLKRKSKDKKKLKPITVTDFTPKITFSWNMFILPKAGIVATSGQLL